LVPRVVHRELEDVGALVGAHDVVGLLQDDFVSKVHLGVEDALLAHEWPGERFSTRTDNQRGRRSRTEQLLDSLVASGDTVDGFIVESSCGDDAEDFALKGVGCTPNPDAVLQIVFRCSWTLVERPRGGIAGDVESLALREKCVPRQRVRVLAADEGA